MNAHERALQLGASRLDFRLAADEARALDAHLGACAGCRLDVDRMAGDARRLAARPSRTMPRARSEAVRATLQRPQRSTSPAMVFVTAVLLVLLTIAVAIVGGEIERRLEQSRLAIEPGPSAPAVPIPTAVPTNAPTPAPTFASAAPSSWELVSAGTVTGPAFETVAVASSGARWVAVGHLSCVMTGDTTADCMAPVATSTDGRTWTTLAKGVQLAPAYVPATSGPEAGVVDLAAGPDGFVAVGFDPNSNVMSVHGAAWWSADGRTWTAVALGAGARPATVIRANDLWLIGGVIYGKEAPVGAVWTSPDGRTWTLRSDATTFDVGAYVDTMEDPDAGGVADFAWNGQLLVAGGRTCDRAKQPCAAMTWVSTDGLAWQRSGVLPAGHAVTSLVSIDGTFVATTRTCNAVGECPSQVLRSDDGLTWTQVASGLSEGQTLVAGASSVLRIGAPVGRTLDVSVSTDGRDWVSVGSIETPAQANREGVFAIVRSDGGFDLLVRFVQMPAEDASTAAWTVTPAR